MIFRQLIDDDTKTYTYLLGDPWSREAVLVDPVREHIARDLGIAREMGLELRYVLETHVHADHVTAAAMIRAHTGAKVVVSHLGGAQGADVVVEDGDAIRFGLQALEVRETPGHTSGCTSYVTADQSKVFTGDALLIRGCGRTDFQQGDARTLYRSVRDKLFSLPGNTAVFPAHDYKGRTRSSIREERVHNPRLGGDKTEDQFVAIMDELKLAYPRKIDVAVPANLRLGLLEAEDAPPVPDPHHTGLADWPMQRTPTGAPNVPCVWVAEMRDRIRLVDVRQPEELSGPDGALEGVDAIPLDAVLGAAKGWDRDAPVVVMCRSGGRSDRAAVALEAEGFTQVASMTGGILRWASLGLPMLDGGQG